MQPQNNMNPQPVPTPPMGQVPPAQPMFPNTEPSQANQDQQPKNTQATPKNPNSTQSSLQFSEIRDNMMIMNDGSFRAVIACKSINFDLMSDREREGVEYSYQNFLNSLAFPIQVLVKSRKVDITPYIDKLVDRRQKQENMLLGVLMDDYIDFIDILSQEANIMEKSFYVVIPYFPNGDIANLLSQSKGFFGKLFAKPTNTITHIDAVNFQKAKDEIRNRVDSVLAGLFQIGVHGVQLDTKLLGELLYSSYNPDTALRQPINNFDNLATVYVRKGEPTNEPSKGPA